MATAAEHNGVVCCTLFITSNRIFWTNIITARTQHGEDHLSP